MTAAMAAGEAAETRSLEEPAYRWGLALVLAAGICWSTIGIGLRMIAEASVWQILFYRSLALAALLIVVMTIRSKGRALKSVRAAGASGLIGGGALVFAFAGGITAIQTTTVANAMLLFATAPFMTALLGLLILREQVRKATWVAMALSMFGVGIMVAGGIALGHWIGNVAGLLSALGFAVFTITLRWRRTDDTLPGVFLGGVLSVIVAGVVCTATGQSLILLPADLGLSFGMGVFQVGAGLVLYSLGSKGLPAGELALLSTLEVLLGPIWVWVILGETASPSTIWGGAILLAALTWNSLSGMRRRPLPVPGI
jgi:DME family drug/metabolite transporter